MKLIVILLWFLFAIISLSDAENETTREAVVSISTDRTLILPCEPLGVAIVIKNTSDETIEKFGSHWTSIRLRREGESETWETYMAYGPHPTLTPPKKLKLFPGQSFEDICLIHVNSKNEPVFKDQGSYYIQAGTPFGDSDVLKVTVAFPESSIKATEAVYENKLFMLFDEYTASHYFDSVGNIEDMSNNLKNCSEIEGIAPYSSWLTFGHFIIKKTMINNQNESSRAVLFEGLVTNYMPKIETLSSPQKESLMIAIANIQSNLSNKKAVFDLLNQILSANKNEYFKIKSQYLRNLYERKPWNDNNHAIP